MATLASDVDVLDEIITITDKGRESLEDKGSARNYASQLPVPKGYKLLIALPEVEEATEGGIIKSSESQREESIATVVGWVMSMGPDAYVNYGRFPSGPYCEVGDWVVFRAFSGTRIKIHGKEFRLINDDTVEAIVDDPRGLERA
jgi:co-chaperonin GroES (HSP10)|tara:strand:- start:947 stop:1381 length:435 start_codon:yes stop_codon:yes gene_type:complete